MITKYRYSVAMTVATVQKGAHDEKHNFIFVSVIAGGLSTDGAATRADSESCEKHDRAAFGKTFGTRFRRRCSVSRRLPVLSGQMRANLIKAYAR